MELLWPCYLLFWELLLCKFQNCFITLVKGTLFLTVTKQECKYFTRFSLYVSKTKYNLFRIGFVLLGIAIIFIIFSLIVHHYHEAKIETLNGQINNQQYNKSLLQYNQFSILIVFGILSYVPLILPVENWLSLDWYIIHQIPHQILMGFVSPLLFYYFNEDMGSFYVRKFWSMAPECLQRFNPDRVIELNV